MGYSCHLLVVVRDLADSANAKYSKEAAKSYLLRFLTSVANSSKTTGVWAVR